MSTFRDRVAIVTGAASGIGAALCHKLAGHGARVLACDRDGEGAAAVAQAIGGQAESARLDVTDAPAVEALAASTMERHGRIDLWFNNAGIAIGGATEDLSLADWQRVLEVNLAGVIHGVHAVYPRMLRQGNGHIVNIASVAGLGPYPLALPYTTSKHAVVGLSRALRAEASGRGVRVSVVCPGAIKTAIWGSAVRGPLEQVRDRMLARLPIRMSAERCAEVILDGVARNRALILVTPEAHFSYWLSRVAPGLQSLISQAVVGQARRMAGQ